MTSLYFPLAHYDFHLIIVLSHTVNNPWEAISCSKNLAEKGPFFSGLPMITTQGVGMLYALPMRDSQASV